MLNKSSSPSKKPLIIFWTIISIVLAFLLYDTYTHPFIPIEWTFENELDFVGFNIHRAGTENGEYTQINTQMVPPAPDPIVGGQHFFTDTSVNWGTTYYYKLETISRNGQPDLSDPIPLRAKFIPLTHP